VQAQNIDDVLAILDDIIRRYRDRRSPLAFFSAVYRATTARVRAGITQGAFSDGARMNRFATVFANRYFAALAPDIGSRSRAWRVAFDAEARPNTMILQHVLLGMNAHINFDLPIAAVSVASGSDLPEIEADFMAINAILAALLDPVQAAINRFSPLLDVLDRVGGRTDEHIVTFSITNARDEAWHEATRLAKEPERQRQRSMLSLDRRVALLAERIIIPGGATGLAIDLIARTEACDIAEITDGLLTIQ
jgi:hypothetical protein